MQPGFLPAVSMLLICALPPSPAQSRTVYRCVQDGTVSLATAPEPGSTCEPREVDDDDPATPNLWGSMGVFSGVLYEREQDGKRVYSTRELPGSKRVLTFTVQTPPGSSAHIGLGTVGRPRINLFDAQFKASSKRNAVDDAWLRATAHAESYFDAAAVSDKGAMGVMQLMPEVAREYGVDKPFDAGASIDAGARHIAFLMKVYEGDLTLVAAAYNAGIGAVTLYDGVPPYAETNAYVTKLLALHVRYREALGLPPPEGSERPAIAAED